MNTPACSFCGKSQAEVWRMIAGPSDIFICNECVDLLHEMVHQSPPPDPKIVHIRSRLKAFRKRE